MMNIREKLVELIGDCKWYMPLDELADHLIANGVTVQEWIPVSERLPEDALIGKAIIICIENRWHERHIDTAYWWGNEQKTAAPWFWGDVTHWMPLPAPPKGE